MVDSRDMCWKEDTGVIGTISGADTFAFRRASLASFLRMI
jgi:hypothetical protein